MLCDDFIASSTVDRNNNGKETSVRSKALNERKMLTLFRPGF